MLVFVVCWCVFVCLYVVICVCEVVFVGVLCV